MSPADNSAKLLRRAFADICNGFSTAALGDRVIYVRHLSHFDDLEIEVLTDRFTLEAEKKGLLTEDQQLKHIITQKLWTKAKEDEISAMRDFINRLEEGKKSISVPSVLKNHEKTIEEERKKLNILWHQRCELMGLTVEIHSSSLINDHYILKNLFIDKTMSSPLYTLDSFDDLTEKEVNSVIEAYGVAVEPCSENNIRRLSVQPFFQRYYYACNGDISTFFGKPVCQLTHYQISLANHAAHFKNLSSQTDLSNLDPEQRKDPDALEKYVNLKQNTDSVVAEGRAPVGMTPDDIKALGLQGQISKAPTQEMSSQQFMEYLSKQKTNK